MNTEFDSEPLSINAGREWVLFLRTAGLFYVRIVVFFETPADAAHFAARCLCRDYAVFHVSDWPGNHAIHVEEMAWMDAEIEGTVYRCLN